MLQTAAAFRLLGLLLAGKSWATWLR